MTRTIRNEVLQRDAGIDTLYHTVSRRSRSGSRVGVVEALSQADIIAGRFQILSPIRHGNMGEVLKARDLESEAGEAVAVKLIWRRRSGEQVSLTEADKNAARFLREVRIMQRLASPNLPRTLAGGLDGDRPYLAMEYIDGITLSELIDESG